jgi:hypothetical protein
VAISGIGTLVNTVGAAADVLSDERSRVNVRNG